MLCFSNKTGFFLIITQKGDGSQPHVHTNGRVDENEMKLCVEKVWSECPGDLLKQDVTRSHVSQPLIALQLQTVTRQ
jgi:hypothetical protein